MNKNIENNTTETGKMKKRKLLNGITIFISIALMACGVFLLVRENVLLPDPSYEEPPPPLVLDNTQTPNETPSSIDPVTTPNPDTQVPDAGDPADYEPTKIYFTKQKQSCEVFPSGHVEGTSQMAVVDRADAASWLMYSSLPGRAGNCIIAGHKSKDGVAGTFKCLWDINVGDLVAVELQNGKSVWFAVESISRFPFDDVPRWVMSYDGETRLTLITCIGEWNDDAGTSSDRLIVVCKPYDTTEMSE